MYRGRRISPAEVAFIGKLITEHPEASRRALSIQLCEAWSWRQANGVLCDGLLPGSVAGVASSGPHQAAGATA